MRKGSKTIQGGTVKISRASISSGAKNTPGGSFKATSAGQPSRSGTKGKPNGSPKRANA